MPRDRKVRERRQQAILEILTEDEPLREQKDLVDRLKAMGFEVTQSSISRDFRDLGVIRHNGYYDLPMKTVVGEGLPKLNEYIQSARTIGPHMVLLVVQPGSAGVVTRIIETSDWPEVAGALASTDDKALILTEDATGQKRVFQRLKSFMRNEPE